MGRKYTHIEMRHRDGQVTRYEIEELSDFEREHLDALADWWFESVEWDLEDDDRPVEVAIVLERKQNLS